MFWVSESFHEKMLRHGHEEQKLDTPKNTSSTLDEGANMFTYKLIEAEGNGSLFTYPEDEGIGVEYLLAEPKCNNLVDDVLGFETLNPQKFFSVGDFSHAVENDQRKIDGDALDSNLTREEEHASLEFLDGMLEGTEGVLQGMNKVPCSCEDFLLDTKLADPVPNLEHGPCGGSSFGNLGLESPSSSFNGRDSGVKYTYNQNSSLHDNMTIHGLHEDFKNIFGGGTSIKDKQWLKLHISFGLQNLVELDNGLNLLKQGVTFNENEAKSNFSSRNEFCSSAFISFSSVVNDKTVSGRQQVKNDSLQTLSSDDNRVGFCILDSGEKDLLVTQKRLRKPTRRYIEEPSEQKGKYHSRKCGISYKRSRDKFPHVGSHEQHRQAGFGASSLDCQQGFFEGACIQVPFGLPVQEGCSKRNTSILGCQESEDCKDSGSLVPNEISEMEPFPAESQDDMSEDDCITIINTQKGRSRRKHHMLWTLSEVMKLIEGVSQYGVGRWTEIKRLLFSSSTHRTSVDLKDKWRNLLRASCTRLHNKREVEQGRKHASHQIPQSVLGRVRELALIYPYPRGRKSKDTCTPVVSPIPSSTGKLVPMSTAVKG